MLVKALGHLGEKIGEPFWRFGVVAMHALDLAGKNDQARQIAPVPIVEALEDVGDDFAGALGDWRIMRRRRPPRCRQLERKVEEEGSWRISEAGFNLVLGIPLN